MVKAPIKETKALNTGKRHGSELVLPPPAITEQHSNPVEEPRILKLTGLKKVQVSKAAAALLRQVKLQQGRSSSLVEDDEFIYLSVALTKIPQRKRKDKPNSLKLPHPLWQLEGAEICLFVKDHKGEGHKEGKARVRQQHLAGVTKVIGLSKLKTKYEAPEAKRLLCKSFDLFLADERIIPCLPKAIGKTFFKKKKQPIPVCLSGKDWAPHIRKATEATYMYKPTGTCLNIRIARASFTPEQCQENVLAVLKQAMPLIPQGWQGVRALFLKTTDSVALPIFQRLPEMTPASMPEDAAETPTMQLD